VLFGKAEVRLEVAPDLLGALLVLEQVEGGEGGQVDPAVEYQGGLEPTVGEEQVALQLWQLAGVNSLHPIGETSLFRRRER
jgi:hypothetical protein